MPDHPPPSYRWAVPLALALVAGLSALWLTARALRRPAEPPREPPEAIDTDRYIRPIEGELAPGSGERIAPFSGFAVSVETEPESALVTISGVERGESPVVAGVECTPGARVQIRVAKAGFRPAQASTVCRTDALVKLTVRLSR